jgi:uncharacterized protein YjiS (DUF1127 family)
MRTRRRHTSHTVDAALRLAAILAAWRERRRERHQLATMELRELRDIGLAPADIHAEVRKPFWRG